MQLSVREQLQQKFSVPSLFEFQSDSGHPFHYIVDQGVKDRIAQSCREKGYVNFNQNEMFDPRSSIDNFLFFWEEEKNIDFEKGYNLDQFGCLAVMYSAELSPCEQFLYFDILLFHPRFVLNYVNIYAFLQYAVNDHYVALARKLSVQDNGVLPPFRHVRVFLSTLTGVIWGAHGIYPSYNALAYKRFSKHFQVWETITGIKNAFISLQPLPFPVDTISELHTRTRNIPAFQYAHDPIADGPLLATQPATLPVVVIPPLPTAMDVPPNMGSDDESSDEDA
jgi:hypothetical protein